MRFPKLYAASAIAGIIGVVAGSFIAGSVSAAFCERESGCLSLEFLWAGLVFILVESCAMSLAVHIANQCRGNLLLTFLPTVLLAIPIPLLLPAFTFVLALLLFLLQTWVCVKVQLATEGGRRPFRRA